MKSGILTYIIAITVFALLATPIRLAAQDQKAQVLSGRKFRTNQHYSRSSPTLRAQTPRLPATVSPDIIWVQCPPDAAAAGASCGYVPVPLHHEHPDGENVNIYFEQYPHTDSGAAESAIFVNPGGPGVTTTGLRFIYIPLFAPNMDKHDMVLFDDRGRGQSGAIDCPSLQHGTGPSFDQEVADCAAQLADDDGVYGTGNVALDTEALRVALGYDKVDYYGASYGSSDVAAYATRFGSHLRSVILDSPTMTPLLAFIPPQGTLRSVNLLCGRSSNCSLDHPHPGAEFKKLVRTLQKHPVEGFAYDANGNLVSVTMDETALYYIMLQNAEIFGTFTQETEIVAAAAALEHGDSLPLLRIGAEGFFSPTGDAGDPTFSSYGDVIAAIAGDLSLPYNWSSPPQERIKQWTEAVSDLPANYFSPYSKGTAAYSVALDSQISRYPAFFEMPASFEHLLPPHAEFPELPTLAMASDVEIVASLEQARQAAALYPDSTFVAISEGIHAPAESQGTLYSNTCAAGLVTNFIETLNVGDTSCAQTPEIIFSSVGRFPLVVADARPAQIDPNGNNQIGFAERKVVTVAVAAATDALKRSTIGSGNGVGLRSGTFQSSFDGNGNQITTLTNCAFANDVTVNGTFTWGADKSFAADLTVSGAGTAGGTLHVEGTWQAPGPVGNFKVSGSLGGRQVAVLVPEA